MLECALNPRRTIPHSPSCDLQAQLLRLLELDHLLTACHYMLRLDTHDVATPAPAILGIFVELLLESLAQLVELVLVLFRNRGERDGSSSLLVHQLPEAAL